MAGTFDQNDYYVFYAIRSFKVYYTETRVFKQTASLDAERDLRLKFTSNENSHFKVDEEEGGRRVLSGSVFVFGQKNK